jgi:hypothetical protein
MIIILVSFTVKSSKSSLPCEAVSSPVRIIVFMVMISSAAT